MISALALYLSIVTASASELTLAECMRHFSADRIYRTYFSRNDLIDYANVIRTIEKFGGHVLYASLENQTIYFQAQGKIKIPGTLVEDLGEVR